MNWAEILEEKNKRIEELEAQLAKRAPAGETDKETALRGDIATEVARWMAAEKIIQWTFDKLKPPIELTADNKLPAVREVRERLGKYLKYLEKK
jgi:hypothetical protein